MARDREAEYRDRQWKTFHTYGTVPVDWEFTGAIKETRDANGKPAGTCELCGHTPIAYKFYLETEKRPPLMAPGPSGAYYNPSDFHPQTIPRLGVGSKCTVNFRDAHPLDATQPSWKKHPSDIAYAKADRAVKQAQKKLAQANKMVKELGLSYEVARFIADHWTIRVERIGDWVQIYVKIKRKNDWYAVWTELRDQTLKEIIETVRAMQAQDTRIADRPREIA